MMAGVVESAFPSPLRKCLRKAEEQRKAEELRMAEEQRKAAAVASEQAEKAIKKYKIDKEKEFPANL